MAEIKYDIVERIAVLSEKGDWTKELNKISWNGKPEKYDLRDWNHKTGRMGKGVTLTEDEVSNLSKVLDHITD